MTFFIFRETFMTHLLLWSNAYAQLIRNGKGQVIDLYPFSNIEQQSLEFVKYTLGPWIIRQEQSLNRALLTDSEKVAYFINFNVDGDYHWNGDGYLD